MYYLRFLLVGFLLSCAARANALDPTLTLSKTQVAEHIPIGSIVGLLSDTQSTGAVTYTLVSGIGGTDNAQFTIQGNILRSAVIFTYATKNSYSIRVHSDNGVGGVKENVFAIGITPTRFGRVQNDNAVLQNTYTSRFQTPATLGSVKLIATGYQTDFAVQADGTIVSWGTLFTGTHTKNVGDIVQLAASFEVENALLLDGTVVGNIDNINGYTSTPPAGLSNVIAISAGNYHALALKSDGTCVTWYNASIGGITAINVPADLPNNVIGVAAGKIYSIALKSDGTIRVWGQSTAPPVNAPANLTNIVAVAAGDEHAVVLKSDGTLVAWGNSFGGRTAVPAGLNNVVAIACGSAFTVALKADGTTVLFGETEPGGSFTDTPALTGIIAISAGRFSNELLQQGPSVSITPNATITNGNPILFSLTFSAPVTGLSLAGITVTNGTPGTLSGSGANYTLPVTPTSDGTVTVTCNMNAAVDANNVGSNVGSASVTSDRTPPSLQISPRNITTSAKPIQFNLSFSEPVTGLAATAISVTNGTKGTLAGSGASYTLLVTPNTDGPVTVNVPAGSAQDTATNGNTAASATVTSNANAANPLQPDSTLTLSRKTIAEHIPIGSIVGILRDTTAPVGNGFIYTLAQGIGDTDNAMFSIQNNILRGAVVFAYAAKSTYSIRVRSDNGTGSVKENIFSVNITPTLYGHIKDDNAPLQNQYVSRFQAPANLGSVKAIATGYETNFAVRADGTIFSWGLLFSGTKSQNVGDVVQLAASFETENALLLDGTVVGNLDSINGYTSTPPAGLNGVIAIAAGNYHTLALKSDGTCVTWYNAGITGESQVEVPAGLNNVVGVAAGQDFSIAVKSDGTISIWGSSLSPAINPPANLTNIVAAAAGSEHAVALKSDGTLVAWGNSFGGRTAVPSGLNNVVAIACGSAFTVALKGDGTTVLFGETEPGGSFADAPALNNIIAVSAGRFSNELLQLNPTVTITPNGAQISTVPVVFTLTFSTPVTGLSASSMSVVNGTLGTLSGSGAVYTIPVTPATDGAVTLSVALNAAQDASGNGSNPGSASVSFKSLLTANPQILDVDANTAKSIVLTGNDPLGRALSFALTSNPSHGTLSGTAPNLQYTPGANYTGADAFQFTVGVGSNISSAATVQLTVKAVVVKADSQTVNVAFNTATSVTLTGSDSSIPPLALTYKVTSNPGNGTLSGSPPNLTYTPNNGFNGPDSFQFTVENSNHVTSGAATVSLIVATGVPSANSQTVAVAFNAPTAVTLTGSDPNLPPLSLSFLVTSNPLHGKLSGTAPNLTYTPNDNYQGTDLIQFAASNGVYSSIAATVMLKVAPGTPSANSQSLTVAHNAAIPIILTGSDLSTPALSLSYVLLSNPLHGKLSGDIPNLVYMPDENYQGSDSFQFTVGNGTHVSEPAAVMLQVSPGIPTADPQSISISFNSSANVTLTGSDPNDPKLGLSYVVTDAPLHGTLSGIAPALTYAPVNGYAGADSFKFKVNNGGLDSSLATVSIQIASPGQLMMLPGSLTGPQLGASYNQLMTMEGGTPPYGFTVTAGGLPAGLALTPAGMLAGTPTTAGTFAFSITAVDSSTGIGPFTATKEFNLTLNPAFTSLPIATPNPAFPLENISFSAVVADASVPVTWDFGDGSQVIIGLSATHAFPAAGRYTVIATAQVPDSSAMARAALTVVVRPESLPALTQGKIIFGDRFDTAEVNVWLPISSGQALAGFAGMPIEIQFNGLSASFTFDKRGRVMLSSHHSNARVVAKSKDGYLNILVTFKGDLNAALASGAPLDTSGRPSQADVRTSFNGSQYRATPKIVYLKDQGTFNSKK